MAAWQDYLVFVLIQIIILIGVFGSLVPFFPGTIIIWLAVLGYGFASGWGGLGIFLFIVLTLLMIFSTLVDNLMMGAGAYKGGANWVSIGLALVAGIIGTIIFPPFGGLIAAPLAVLLLEFYRKKNLREAAYALLGMVTGFGLSYLARFGIALVMMVLWWIWVWKG